MAIYHNSPDYMGDIESGDSGSLTKSHAVRAGVHDAISDVVKWTTTAVIVLGVASFILPEKTRVRILKKAGL